VKHIKDLQSTHAETIIPTGKLQIAKTQFLSQKPEAYKFTWQEHKPYTLHWWRDHWQPPIQYHHGPRSLLLPSGQCVQTLTHWLIPHPTHTTHHHHHMDVSWERNTPKGLERFGVQTNPWQALYHNWIHRNSKQTLRAKTVCNSGREEWGEWGKEEEKTALTVDADLDLLHSFIHRTRHIQTTTTPIS